MRAHYQIFLASAAVLALAAPFLGRGAAADPPTTLATTTTGSVAVARGGVRYDSMLPLEAVLTPRFDVKNPPPLALTYAVTYKGGEGETVPALFTVPTGATGKTPCVIVEHGLGGRKEDVYLLSAALAKHGYSGLFIDIAGHGERPRIGGKSVGELSLPLFRRMVGQTVADLRRGVDFLVTRPEVDPDRIGYLGASLGGIIGGVFVADEPRVRVAALWAAGGNWGKMIATSQHAFARRFRQGPDAVPAAEIGSVMADVDPVTTVGAIAPRPLLLINGDKDDIVPTSCTDDLYAAAQNPKKRIVIPGGHVPELSRTIGTTMEWLNSNLK